MKLFQAQLKEASERFDNLKIIREEDSFFLKGVLDVYDDDRNVAGSFLIEVRYKEGFPYRFPILFETGGVIPNEADWHKYHDSSCCITVSADEILTCKTGISVISFIEKQATGFLANYIYRKIEGRYKNGEYAHGIEGVQQFYTTLFKTNEKELWIKYYKNTFRNLRIESKRNEKCFCGSDVKFKYCHLEVFDKLRVIGEKQVLGDFQLVLS